MTLSEQLSIELLEQLNPVLEVLRVRRPPLADQIERAATSVALNTAERYGRTPRDGLRALRIASGEAHEVKAGLAVARALRYVAPELVAPPFATADRLCGVLHGLIRKLT